MKITKVLGFIGVAILVFFILLNDGITSMLVNLVVAGIIPGTKLQLPWYVILVLVPLLLFGVWRIIRSFDFAPATIQTEAPAAAKPERSAIKKSSPKQRPARARKTKKQDRAKASRKKASKKTTAAVHAI